VTPEQKTAHLRMLEALPKRFHQCIGPEMLARRNPNWQKPKIRDVAFTPEFLAAKKLEIDRLKAQGLNQKQIADLWETSASSVSRYLKLYEKRCSQR
jgi:DNA-binding NarL/FixJ family response regulator